MTVRRKRGNIFLWLILAIMIVAMGGLGLNSALQSSRSSTVFKVGESEITQGEYYNALQAQIANISQQQGQPLTMSEAKLIGVPDQVKARLINQATLSEIARRNNIRPSDDAVGRELLSIQAFQDAAGNFSRQNLNLFLKNRGLTEDQFLATIRTNLERDMVLTTLAGQPLKIDHLTGLIASQVGEERIISYMRLESGSPEDIEAPSEAEIQARYDEDPTRFLGQPARSFELAYALPKTDEVTEEEIQNYYDSHQADFGTAAVASYEVLAFQDETAANEFYETADFEALASERGLELKDYLFENQSISALPKDLAAEIEAQGVGIYAPIKSLLGWNVYKVTEFTKANVKPIAEVESEIRNAVASENLNTQLTEEYAQISEMISDGANPKLISESTSLDYIAWNNSDAPIAGLTDQTEFANEADQTIVGEERALVKLPNGGVFVLLLNSEEDAKPLPYDDVHDQIQAELVGERLNASQDQIAEAMLGEIESTSMSEVAEQNGLTLITSEPTNSQESFTTMPLAISFEAFQKNKGDHWVARDQNDLYIAQIDDIIEFDSSTDDGKIIHNAVADQVNGATTEGMVVDFLNAAAQEYGAVQFNALIDQVEAQIN